MSEDQPPRASSFASSHPFQPLSESSVPDGLTNPPPQTGIPLTTLPPPPTYAGSHSQSRNADLEAGLASSEPTPGDPSSEAPPNYKEQDMEEPLPPYMARVRAVMRGEQPVATAMPAVERRTGFLVVGFFILAVLIIIGIGVGVRVGANL